MATQRTPWTDLGYSRDQFYRRIRWLTAEGEIAPDKGAHGRILLSAADTATLEAFESIETAKRPEDWSLGMCLMELRLRRDRDRLASLQGRLVEVQNYNRTLWKALQRLLGRRHPVRRLVRWFAALVTRNPTHLNAA